MRLLVMTGGAVCLAAAAGVVGYVGAAGDPGASDDPDPVAEATAEVRRGDLVETTSASGALEYADARDLGSDLAGTVTWLPRSGRVVRAGGVLLEVDTAPVVRLDGTVPAWRALGPGATDGVDVRQLERALRDLGYADDYDLAVDRTWTWATTEAVEDWQEDLGVEATGSLPLGTVVFTDGDLRVSGRLVEVGDRVAPGTAVLEVSGVQRRVTVSLETTQRHLAPVGGEVELDFPDGATARGRIVEVETLPAADEQSEETLAVTVQPLGRRSERRVADQLDGASVQVSFTDTIAKDRLVVPVTALVALEDGGYAVEVVAAGESRLVPVTTEAYGDSDVAVTGDLAAGDRVVVTP